MSVIFPGATAQQVGGYFPRAGLNPNLALFVVHITAGLGDALAIAKSVEAKEVTASFWTNRDGRVYQTMLDPIRMGPWTNGALNGPDLTNPRIANLVRAGVNPNTRCLLTIENAGLEPGSPITAAQEAACARIISYFARKYGVPISRETVVGHYQFDRVNRPNCPSTNKAILDRIVAMAQSPVAGGAGDNMPVIEALQGLPDGAAVQFAAREYQFFWFDPATGARSSYKHTFAAATAAGTEGVVDLTGDGPAYFLPKCYVGSVGGMKTNVYLPTQYVQAGELFIPAQGGFTQADLDEAHADGVTEGSAARDAEWEAKQRDSLHP